MIEDFNLDNHVESWKKINYSYFIDKNNKLKVLSLIETKSINHNINEFIHFRSFYYGLHYYYDYVGEKSQISTVFEVLDNYFLKKFNGNYHKFIRNFGANFVEKFQQKGLAQTSFFRMIYDSLETTYYHLFDFNQRYVIFLFHYKWYIFSLSEKIQNFLKVFQEALRNHVIYVDPNFINAIMKSILTQQTDKTINNSLQIQTYEISKQISLIATLLKNSKNNILIIDSKYVLHQKEIESLVKANLSAIISLDLDCNEDIFEKLRLIFDNDHIHNYTSHHTMIISLDNSSKNEQNWLQLLNFIQKGGAYTKFIKSIKSSFFENSQNEENRNCSWTQFFSVKS